MEHELIKTHVFVFNPRDNGGESLILATKYYTNGDPDGYYTNQEITLNSYCNSSTIGLFGTSITPHTLRKLADELELAETEVKDYLEKVSKPKKDNKRLLQAVESFLKTQENGAAVADDELCELSDALREYRE